MIPIKGVYLLLIMAGSPDVPERIGLEQQLNTEACQQNAHRATEQKKYAFVRCIEGGSIVSQSLAYQDRQISSGPPPMRGPAPSPPFDPLRLGQIFGFPSGY